MASAASAVWEPATSQSGRYPRSLSPHSNPRMHVGALPSRTGRLRGAHRSRYPQPLAILTLKTRTSERKLLWTWTPMRTAGGTRAERQPTTEERCHARQEETTQTWPKKRTGPEKMKRNEGRWGDHVIVDVTDSSSLISVRESKSADQRRLGLGHPRRATSRQDRRVWKRLSQATSHDGVTKRCAEPDRHQCRPVCDWGWC